jgi:hypothetical protein
MGLRMRTTVRPATIAEKEGIQFDTWQALRLVNALVTSCKDIVSTF